MALQHVALSHVMSDSSGSSMSDAAASARYRDLFQWAVSLLQSGVIKGIYKGNATQSVQTLLAKSDFGKDPFWQYSSFQPPKPSFSVGSSSLEGSVLASSSPALLAYLQLAAQADQQQQQQQSPKHRRLQRPYPGSAENLKALHAWASSLQVHQDAETPSAEEAAATRRRRSHGGFEESDTLQLLHAFAALDDSKSRSDSKDRSSSSSARPVPVKTAKARVSWADSCERPTAASPAASHDSNSSSNHGNFSASPAAPAGGSARRSQKMEEVLPAFQAWALLAEEHDHNRQQRQQQQQRHQEQTLLTSSHIPSCTHTLPGQQHQQHLMQDSWSSRSSNGSSCRQSFSHSCRDARQAQKQSTDTQQQQQQQQRHERPLARMSAPPATYPYSSAAAAAGLTGYEGSGEELNALRYLVGLSQQQQQQQLLEEEQEE